LQFALVGVACGLIIVVIVGAFFYQRNKKEAERNVVLSVLGDKALDGSSHDKQNISAGEIKMGTSHII